MKPRSILPLVAVALAAATGDAQAQARAGRPAPPPARPAAAPAARAAAPRAATPADTAKARPARRRPSPSRARRGGAVAARPAGDSTRRDWATGLVRNPPAPTAADAAVRAEAFRAAGKRVIVSLAERRMWYMDGRDTLYTAPVAVGKGTRLEYGSRAWRFNTPRGVRRVLEKRPNPVWTPPEWHYAEIARDSGWALARLTRGAPVRLRDGGRLVVRGDRVVYVHANGGEEIIPDDEEIIFDDTIFIPPEDTRNRRIEGELGAYALSLGGGYLLHGTPHKESIGQAATHGCIRLGDEAIAYLYRNVGVGTPVYIF
jgi:lipoprotein-anchoring transpeptidase ErfK/SrfK